MRLPSGGDAIYEVLSHTADTGISARGATLGAVIGTAAFAMFDLMYDLDRAGPGATIELVFETTEAPDLLVTVLSELLYRSETEDIAFSDIEVSTGDNVVVAASTIPVDKLEPSGPPIKAVTYHNLRCEPTDDGWFAQIIFDV